MASKRKKEVQYEADSSQARVDDYFRKNPMTGNPFKDIGGLLATRDDRERATAARKSLDTAADRDVTMRGQDFVKEQGLDANNVARMGHQLGFDAEMGRTAAYAKGQDQQFELGKDEVSLNRDIFGMTKDRYDKTGRIADDLNLRKLAMETQVIGDEFGLEEGDITKGIAGGYLGKGDSIAKPQGKIVDETGIYFDNVPNAPVNDSSIPDWLQPKDFRSYNTTGIESLDATLGALNEGVKSMVFRPAYAANDLFGIPSPTAKPRTQRNSLRRKVRKVN